LLIANMLIFDGTNTDEKFLFREPASLFESLVEYLLGMETSDRRREETISARADAIVTLSECTASTGHVCGRGLSRIGRCVTRSLI
jgi:hypothetical protein